MSNKVTVVRDGSRIAFVYSPIAGGSIGLEGSADFILMETGDKVLVESGASADISAFGAATTLGGTEDILGVQGGNSRRITPAQIKTYVNA